MALQFWSLLLLFFFCSSQGGVHANSDKEKFSFEDIYDHRFQSRSFSLQWSGKEDVFTYHKNGDIVEVNASNVKKDKVLFSHDQLKDFTFTALNAKRDMVLGGEKRKQKWRHSFVAEYSLMKQDGKKVKFHGEALDFAGWSPDGQALSYVHKSDLYVTKKLDKPFSPIRVTKDESEHIFNGIPDWLYEEEILSSRVSHYWSHDSSKICYARIDDTQAGKQHWLVYGDKDTVVEKLENISYPKAGLLDAPTSKVTLKVASIKWDTQEVTDAVLSPPEDLVGKDHYFLLVKWINAEKLYVIWSDRLQITAYHTYYTLTDKNTLPPVLMYKEEGAVGELNGWIDVPPTTPFFPNGDENLMITLLTHKPKNSKSSWKHLVKLTKKDDKYEKEFLMESQREVTSLLKIDANYVYFVQTGKNSTERKLSKINWNNKREEDLAVPADCKYVGASFSATGKYYLRSCLGPAPPSYTLASTLSDYPQTSYENNTVLKTAMASRHTVTKQYIFSENLFIELYKPALSTSRKLPLLVYTYAGPGTQEVSERIDYGSRTKNWLLHVASTYDVAIASIDGRGTSGNGEELKKEMYQKMGVVEVEDQIKGIRILAKRKDIDKDHISIFGWSYGGFTAAAVLADSKEVKCAMSVAPVTNEALYAPRCTLSSLPQRTNLQYKAANFANKSFLVAHGTADDNVHFTNFAHLIRELELNGIMFTQLSYPDEAHSISTPSLNKHLFHSMSRFFEQECLPPPSTTQSSAPVTFPLLSASLFSLLSLLLFFFSFV